MNTTNRCDYDAECRQPATCLVTVQEGAHFTIGPAEQMCPEHAQASMEYAKSVPAARGTLYPLAPGAGTP